MSDMTVITEKDVIESVADALQYISYYHPMDYIRALGEAAQLFAIALGLQIEHGAAFVARIGPPEERALDIVLVRSERSQPPCGRSFGRFDADDVRAEVGEHHAAELAALITEIEYSDSVEHDVVSPYVFWPRTSLRFGIGLRALAIRF